ncbi:immunoglobulin-like domain-containing protein [Paenibacillus sp. CF384]|uniref:immunoglobulin-like domain-containing protein n=1 Tax=Paenibacillus sp. CF384 TaxID=1884382 RepID=UPI00089D7B14|nr:immunoglobulin-like domain-containing protein [Paenibacillus sp. CF384]SDW71396.1 hypothetical protein SAMN05518855_1004244 [Paenibacillus sp. CF384]
MYVRMILFIVSCLLVMTGCMKEQEKENKIQSITLINTVHKGENQPPKMIFVDEVIRLKSKFQKEQDITFELTKREYEGNEMLQYTIENKSDNSIPVGFDEGYMIEVLENQKWVSVSFGRNYDGFFMAGYSLKDGQKFTKDLSKVKWLDTGKYRVVKSVFINKDERVDLISDSFNVIKK